MNTTLEVEIHDAATAYSKPGIIGCQFTCVKCRQMLWNYSGSLWPWYMHECYKVRKWVSDPCKRSFLTLVVGARRNVLATNLRSIRTPTLPNSLTATLQ